MEMNDRITEAIIFSDKPIQTIQEDRLGRSHAAEALANLLLSKQDASSLCFLINGKWGSGKTSLINLVKENLTNRIPSIIGNGQLCPVLVDFSPWNAKDVDGVITQFFVTLSAHFSEGKIREFIEKVLNSSPFRTVEAITDVASSLSAYFKPLKFLVSSIKKYGKTYLNNKTNDLAEMKEEINLQLSKSPFRYVVFIDDLDRLNDDEIRCVIQLIKAVCNFANIIYVVAFDKDMVARALDGQNEGGTGRAYLEKVIQLEYDLPVPKSSDVITFTAGQTKDLLERQGHSIDEMRLESILNLGLFSKMQTLRKAKRFLNHLLEYLIEFGGSIDVLDLVVLAYFRSINDQSISLISSHRFFLRKAYSSSKNDLGAMLEEWTKLEVDDNGRLLRELFCLDDFDGLDEPIRKRRICNRELLNYFLDHDKPAVEFPLERVEACLKNADEQEIVTLCMDFSEEHYDKYISLLKEMNLSNVNQIQVALDSILKNKRTNTFSLAELDLAESFISRILESKTQKEMVDSLINWIDGSNRLLLIFRIIGDAKETPSREPRSMKIGIKEESINGEITDALLRALFRNDNVLHYGIERIIKFAATKRENEMRVAIAKYDMPQLVRIMAIAVLIGSYASGNEHGLLYYPPEYMKCVVDWAAFIGYVKRIRPSDIKPRDYQRAITYFMMADNWEVSDRHDGGYSSRQITKYCKENGIDFEANDLYERLLEPTLK